MLSGSDTVLSQYLVDFCTIFVLLSIVVRDIHNNDSSQLLPQDVLLNLFNNFCLFLYVFMKLKLNFE